MVTARQTSQRKGETISLTIGIRALLKYRAISDVSFIFMTTPSGCIIKVFYIYITTATKAQHTLINRFHCGNITNFVI